MVALAMIPRIPLADPTTKRESSSQRISETHPKIGIARVWPSSPDEHQMRTRPLSSVISGQMKTQKAIGEGDSRLDTSSSPFGEKESPSTLFLQTTVTSSLGMILCG